MGLINDLLGAVSGKKARTIADVEAALERLASQRATAKEAVAAAMRQRDELLLVDETDKKIADLDAVADRHRLTLERVDKAEPLLLSELEGLRTEAKAALWRDLRGRYDQAALDFAAALRVVVERQHGMLAVNEEARRAGFEHEVQATFVPPARAINVDALNIFEAAIERAREMARPAPQAPAPRPAAPPPKAAPRVVASPPKPVNASPRPAPPKPAFVATPDKEGNLEVVFLKSGIELPDGSRPKVGNVVKLTEKAAYAAVRASVAEYKGALK